jgi:peptidyl-prolyl cis-trans isomerase D
MARKKSANIAVWILMLLLIIGLGGFGATSFGGTIRKVGSVGDEPISTDAYARALQQELRAIEAQTQQPLSIDQAQALGLTTRTLNRVVTETALDGEAARVGLSVGDVTVAEQLQLIPAFQGLDGKFDRENYQFALDRNGLSESEFEGDLRRETARSLLQGAVVAGRTLPDAYVDTMLNYLAETRSITYARVEHSQLDGPTSTPSESDLQALYEEQIGDYTLPERKRITYALLTPDMLIEAVEVDEDLLKQEYEARLDEFQRPERRLVERLNFTDAATAQAAADRIANGETDFDRLVEDRGLRLDDIDLGDVSKREIGGAAGDAVFAAASGDVVGPVETNLGPALFRVNGILAEQITTFEQARDTLREDLAADRARRRVDERAEPIEDLLAGGATLEEVVAETDMRLETIDWYPDLTEGIAGYADFDAAAAALTTEDFPEIAQLEDGSIYAMRLDEILAPAPIPFDEVRDKVVASWETRESMARLNVLANDYLVKMGGAADFESLGLTTQTEEALRRQGSILGAPERLVTRVFAMQPGENSLIEGFGAVFLVRLDAINAPDVEDADTAQLRDALREQLSASVAQDIYRAYTQTLRSTAGVTIDETALNAVHANFR